MSGRRNMGYDVATALWQGARPYQEDTLLADFHGGVDRGFAVLADGMGGHAAGDLASRLVVIDAASHLKFLMHDGPALEHALTAELTSAIDMANTVLKDRAAEDRRLIGMGATFLAIVVFEDRLYWASVGDSPLYLWREGVLRQLNEDHSMAPVIDQMARAGEITPEQAAAHPDRNALTSVLMGGSLKSMDVPETATVLDPGDVLIQASDGLQYLDEEQISDVVAKGGSSRDIADALMGALRVLDDPGQDNTAVLVLQLAPDDSGAAASTTGAGMASASPPGPRAAGAATPTPKDGSTTGSARAAPPLAPSSDASRPAGARRWVVPAGLAMAAVVAGLLLWRPGDAPDTPAVDAAQAHDIVGETAPGADGAPATDVPIIVGTKPALTEAAEPAQAAAAATIEFDAATPEPAPLVPGANAVRLDQLRPVAPIQDAGDGSATEQQTLPAPDNQRPLAPDARDLKQSPRAMPEPGGGARHG